MRAADDGALSDGSLSASGPQGHFSSWTPPHSSVSHTSPLPDLLTRLSPSPPPSPLPLTRSMTAPSMPKCAVPISFLTCPPPPTQ